MQQILDAILADAPAEEFANLTLPESYRAVTVHKDEVDMFEGIASKDKDPRKSLHLDEVALRAPSAPNRSAAPVCGVRVAPRSAVTDRSTPSAPPSCGRPSRFARNV